MVFADFPSLRPLEGLGGMGRDFGFEGKDSHVSDLQAQSWNINTSEHHSFAGQELNHLKVEFNWQPTLG